MKKHAIAAFAALAAIAATAEPGGARDAFLNRQAYDGMVRISGQVDVLQANQEELSAKLREMSRAAGGANGDVEALKAEVAGLKAQIASLRSDMQSMRGEIVQELTGKIQQIVRQVAPPPAPAARPGPQLPDKYREYVVKPGDTLSLVADAFGTRVSTIKEMNGLKSDMLRVGQKLKVPK